LQCFNKLSFPFINLVELSSSERSCFLHAGVFANYTQMIREAAISRELWALSSRGEPVTGINFQSGVSHYNSS
jgi:hypothetical protein